MTEQYRQVLEQTPATDLRDVCYTANTGRSHFSHRACFLAADAEQMKQQLAAFASPAVPVSTAADRVCFLCTGQGSQYVGMGQELYGSSPVYRAAIERCAVAWKEQTGESLIEVLYPAATESGRAHAERGMKQARYAQASLFALEYGLAELWRSWGIEPSVVLGHSLGEYVAAVIAGSIQRGGWPAPGLCAGAADGHLDATGSDAIDWSDGGAGAAGDSRAGIGSRDRSD